MIPNVTNDDETAMLSIELTREAEAALTSHDILAALAARGLIVVPAVDGGWMWFVLLDKEPPRYLGPDKPFKTA
jgi:predicted DNA-binding transcriptional regulator